MNTREQAIAAAEAALFDQEAGVGGGGTAWWQRDTVAAETVLDAAVPVLLNDLAAEIEAMPASVGPLTPGSSLMRLPKSPYEVRADAAQVVRAAAEGWGQ